MTGDARERLARAIAPTAWSMHDAYDDDEHRSGPWSGAIQKSFAVADRILAAGFTLPRTVSTVEELEALPVGSVIRDSGRYLYEVGPGSWFFEGGVGASKVSATVIALPATVLHEGGAS